MSRHRGQPIINHPPRSDRQPDSGVAPGGLPAPPPRPPDQPPRPHRPQQFFEQSPMPARSTRLTTDPPGARQPAKRLVPSRPNPVALAAFPGRNPLARVIRRVGGLVRAAGIALGISVTGLAVGVLVAALAGLAQGGGGGTGSSDFAALTTRCLPGIACEQRDTTQAVDVPVAAPVGPPAEPPIVPPAQEESLIDPPSIIDNLPLPRISVPGLMDPEPANPPPTDPPSSPAQPPDSPQPLGRVTYLPPPLTALGLPILGLDGKIVVTNISGQALTSWSTQFKINGDARSLSGGQLTAGGNAEFSTGISLTLGDITISDCTFNDAPCG